MTEMDFAPMKGWIRNGPDYSQDFAGWKVYANKPDFPATAVILARAPTETQPENGE